MKNKIYTFWGENALLKSRLLMEEAGDLGVMPNCIDMMQDNNGNDDTLMVSIAIFTNMENILRLDNFELFLDNKYA